MTKLRNKIVLVLLALCLVACMALTVACGGDDKKPTKKPSTPTEVTYTVTVKIDGTATKDVKVTVKKGSVSLGSKTTGEDGKAEFTLAQADDYTVELSELPENYEVPADATLTFPADRNLTVNLAEKFAYKVKLVNPDGTPLTMAGVTVGLCTLDGTCYTPVALDANGVARLEQAKNDYHIHILGLPDGYAYEADSEGYAAHQTEDGTYIWQGVDNTYNSLSATVTEQTIKVYPVEEIKLVDEAKLTPEQKEELYVNGNDAYKMTVQVPANGVAYYVYNPEYTGVYYLRATSDANINVHVNPSYLRGNNSLGRNIVGPYGNTQLTKGEKKYINIVNNGDEEATVDLIMATPSFTYATVTAAGTVDVTFYKENVTSVIELQPTIGAKFKATVQGDAVAAIASSNYEIDDYEMNSEYYLFYDEDSYGTGKYCEFKFTEDRIGGSVYLAVCAKAENYPVTVSVKIEKELDIANTYNTKTTEATLKKYNRPENKELVPLPFDIDGETELVKDEDGYYYYDGKIVMVNLKGDLDLDRFSAGGALVYIELATNGMVNPYVVDVTSDEDRDSLDKGNTYDDYRELLRGFKDYKYDKQNNPSVPNAADILVDKYYAKADFVNEDGAYPLTDELIDILKIITEQISENNGMMLPEVDNYENLWMFACYYYDDYMEPDAIAGEYKFVKYVEWGETKLVGDVYRYYDMDAGQFVEATRTEDDYKLVVNKRGKFTIYQLNSEGNYEAAYGNTSGNWTKEDETYTFTVPPMPWEDMGYDYAVVFNATTGRLTLVSEDGTIWIFQKGGANKLVNVYEDETEQAMFEVYDNNTFKLYVGNAFVASGTHKPNADGSQVAVAVTDKVADVTAVTVVYDDGIYTVTVDAAEYQIITDKAPVGAVYTEDGNAMLKLYMGAFRFYLKDGENFVQYAYGTVGGDDEQNPEIEFVEKHESVKDAIVVVDLEQENEQEMPTKYDITVKVTYTNDTEMDYLFDMLTMFGYDEGDSNL